MLSSLISAALDSMTAASCRCSSSSLPDSSAAASVALHDRGQGCLNASSQTDPSATGHSLLRKRSSSRPTKHPAYCALHLHNSIQ